MSSNEIVVNITGDSLKWWQDSIKCKLVSRYEADELYATAVCLSVESIYGKNISQLTSLRQRYLNIYRTASKGISYEMLYRLFGGTLPFNIQLEQIAFFALEMSLLVKRQIVEIVRNGRAK